MKKLLALILILPIFISAEDIEYPIELTCESGPWIHHMALEHLQKEDVLTIEIELFASF